MMDTVPAFVNIFFVVTTLLTVFLFCRAVEAPKFVAVVLIIWLAVQAVIALTGFYVSSSHSRPPGFILVIVLPFLLILFLFATNKGRVFLDSLDIKALTMVHIVRAPVELVLFWLFLYGTVPRLMTFEGRNFDILSGLTAPLIYYFAFRKGRVRKGLLLIWSFICLELLLNIIVNAMLSAPLPFQQFAFKHPNIAVLYFPFVWLPCCIVPLVLLSHLVTIRQLILDKNN